jgi:hypothetical protein
MIIAQEISLPAMLALSAMLALHCGDAGAPSDKGLQ